MENDDSNTHLRKIQIYPFIDSLHSAYNTIINNPPEGYEFIGIKKSKKQAILEFAKSSKILRFFYHQVLRLIKTTALLDFLSSSNKLSDAEIIFSISTLYKGDSKWILHILDNTPHGLAGFNHILFIKNLQNIENILSRNNCKKIICSNKSSSDIMKKYFSPKVTEKIIIINRPVIIEKIKNKKRKNETTLLFIGSLKNPDDFYIRGGLEALTVFEKISKNYPVRLIIKCKIPEELKKRISSNKSILLIEEDISQQEVSNLYNSSDIFLFPAHSYMGSIVEAMSFSLSVVGLDTFAVSDYIKDRKTGILVKKSGRIKEYNEESYPTNLRAKKFVKELENLDSEVIERLYNAVEYLIKNPKIRKKIGENARKLVIKEHSLENNNQLLKRVFDEALE